MTRARPPIRRKVVIAICGALFVLAALVPASVMGAIGAKQSYLVVMKGGYALDGSYALGQGYALVGQESSYALDGTYALGRQYALYALNRTYALLDQYALTSQFQQTHDYALFGQYALNSGYALATNYALGEGYLLAALTGSYALNPTYALADDAVGYALSGNYALLDEYALGANYALARDYALAIISKAGGTVTADLTKQIGMMVVESRNTAFAQILKANPFIQSVGIDFASKQFPSLAQALSSGQLVLAPTTDVEPIPGKDLLEDQQWGMQLIHAREAQARQSGNSKVRIGIVDSGIDGNHLDFKKNGVSNVDCQHGADFTFDGPGIGNPLACVDNNFHGTHVAGIVAARRNGIGVVGVAPNVTLVPIKACDANGSCYVSDAVQGITYAGDLKLNAINMSFFIDDDDFNQSTEFKCQSNDTQRAYREAIERSLKYARSQGVSLIAALGNSDTDLANPPGGKSCKTVPAMSKGVTGTVALGPDSEKAAYSSWGAGYADVSAPGGNDVLAADCTTEVLSTLPGNLYGCFQGTSMASPHTTGAAALIISQFGHLAGGRWVMAPDKVTAKLTGTAVDIGKKGVDKCFGYGRIDALRAVKNDTSAKYDSTAPFCPEYTE
jgi:hypothetical protein